MHHSILVLAAAATLGACAAEPKPPAEIGYAAGALGYTAILEGDLATAEAQLKASPAHRDDPARLLNLAYIYQLTGRDAEAAALYRRVLDGREDPMLALKTGEPARAKALARAGLRQVGS